LAAWPPRTAGAGSKAILRRPPRLSRNGQPQRWKQETLREKVFTPDFQLTLIKAMIAAAKADGHIDAAKQQAISSAVEQLERSAQLKGLVFDLLHRPIALNELAARADSIEQKSAICLTSCLAIDPDHPSEQAHLEQLAQVLALPDGLAEQLQRQARMN
jgi:uncharacterized membrane protein YebE (DUF533 family)